MRVARLRGGQGVVGNRGGIRAVCSGDNVNLESLAPEFELLDRGGAEGVARGQQRGVAARLNQAAVVVFPVPLTPTIETTLGPSFEKRSSR
jgi:hypothetical protein